jgi:hypothetical protein
MYHFVTVDQAIASKTHALRSSYVVYVATRADGAASHDQAIASKTHALRSSYVVYVATRADGAASHDQASLCFWMIPGTCADD